MAHSDEYRRADPEVQDAYDRLQEAARWDRDRVGFISDNRIVLSGDDIRPETVAAANNVGLQPVHGHNDDKGRPFIRLVNEA